MIPAAPGLPQELTSGIAELGRRWAASALRPRPSEAALALWDQFLAAWLADPAAPLLVRKHDPEDAPRGSVLIHRTGRPLVPVDNSPANWAYGSALLGLRLDLPGVLEALQHGLLPIAMALRTSERQRARYTGVLGRRGGVPNLNAFGWTVAHLDPVGLGTRAPLPEVPIDEFLEHHRLLLSPRNIVLVPKTHDALAELPEFLEMLR